MRDASSGSTLPRKFLSLGLLLGTLFLVLNPPFAVNDEDMHLARIYELSKGQLLTHSDSQGEYHYVPVDYRALGERYQAIPQRRGGRVHARNVLEELRKPRPREPLTRMRARAAGYSPISYHLQIPVVWLARQLDVGAMWHLYLARSASLAVYLFLAFRAVSLAGRLAWLFIAVALMPMALTQAAGVSTDGLIIGLSLLFFAHIARGGVLPGPALTRAELAASLLCLGVMTLSKPVYAVAGIALLVLRWEGPRARLWRPLFAAASMLFAASIFVLWNRLVSSAAAPPEVPLAPGPYDPTEQLWLLLREPWRIVQLGFGTLFRTGDDLLLQSIFVRYRISPGMPFAGGLTSILYAQLLLGLAWGAARTRDLEAGGSERAQDIAARRRRLLKVLALGLSWLGILCAVPSALYLCCTVVGAGEIRGFHGRYLIPAFPALLLALSLLGRPVLRRWLLSGRARTPWVVIVFANLLCLFSLIGWHYYSETIEWPL